MVAETLSKISSTTHDCRVGVDPVQRVLTLENHDQAYHAWKQARLRDRIAVHIDAHMDFDWVPEKDPEEILQVKTLREVEERAAQPCLWNFSGRSMGKTIQIGNYLNPALREGLIKSFCWVVPDGFFKTRRQRKRLAQMVSNLGKTHRRAFEKVAWVNGSLTARIYGKPVSVCTLSAVPEFEEPILLDIDTDFMLIGSISSSYPYVDLPRTEPWIWPQELVARLGRRGLRTDFVTIAYSVEGGFTPLGYKHLGDEVAGLLRSSPGAVKPQQTTDLKRCAALLRQNKKLAEARQAYEHALSADPRDPSIYYQLAQICYEQGQADSARRHYRRAIELDPTYRTAYNTFGSVLLALGRLTESEGEYRKALAFDPEDVHALCGLGDLCAEQRRWQESILHYRKAAELRPDHGEAHLSLGCVYVKRRNWKAAEEKLKLALASEKHQALARYWLGFVYLKRRRWEEALSAYKAARRLGLRNLQVYWSLGRLYWRKGNLYQASRHFRRVIRALPVLLWINVRHLLRKGRKILWKGRDDRSGSTLCQG